ncbi:dml-1 [Plectosphaerella plurivora]|uniref:Dml-1 n=1 Tax=Plectosphaerella plurivora TaxID=936078 RepID=A0A9P9A4H4_9PEZI|nr:dml-1 [Plectosphaerella plurivora]
MHEIITLQLGQASNYVATHFWNAQESYFTYGDDPAEPAVDSNVHWRAGIGSDGAETFLPRTVIYDLKGGFGSLRKINALYEPPENNDAASASSALTWSAKPVVHKLPAIPQSIYQQSLDAGETAPGLTSSHVRYWSDFSRVFYHPKSLNQLYDYELNSSIQPFEDWHLGQELFKSLDRGEDMVDRDFRPFIEEADQMQAIQLFTCLDDAWGGFATDYVDRLRDEYPKATIWVWGTQTPRLPRGKLHNLARSIASMCEQATMLVPLSIPAAKDLSPNIRLGSQSPWQTSALLSTAVETAGFASRTTSKRGRETLGDIAASLNTGGKQTLSRLEMTVSQAWSPNEDTQSTSFTSPELDSALDVDLFRLTSGQWPSRTTRPTAKKCFGQSWALRAMSGVQNNNDEDEEAERHGHSSRDGRTHRLFEKTPFPLVDSFPAIYTSPTGAPLSESAGVTTRLSTDTGVSNAVKELRSFVAASIGVEEREDLGNELAELADAYRDGWSSGSDDDDD